LSTQTAPSTVAPGGLRQAGSVFTARAHQAANPMRTRRATSIEDLRQAIGCLPARTKLAMLQGIDTNPIIVGAYSTRDGICPMLAAHRAGGRTDLIAFARAWDRVALGGRRRPKPRRATDRELLILRSHLEYSLLNEGDGSELAAAIADHRELIARRPPPPAKRSGRVRPGDPDRSRELRAKPGWRWTRLFRRYDDYELALERLAEQERPAERLGGQDRPRELARR
jgi:hypothetical protein